MLSFKIVKNPCLKTIWVSVHTWSRRVKNDIFCMTSFMDKSLLWTSIKYITENVFFSKISILHRYSWQIYLLTFATRHALRGCSRSRLRSVRPFASVWGKTTLNTGSVGGTGADPQIEKWVYLFLCP